MSAADVIVWIVSLRPPSCFVGAIAIRLDRADLARLESMALYSPPNVLASCRQALTRSDVGTECGCWDSSLELKSGMDGGCNE